MQSKGEKMIRTGLVSITFRNLSVKDIIKLVKQAGLDGIEWGGDIHVPHGDIETAKKVRELTVEAGLAIPSYGSYYRIGTYENYIEEFKKVLDSAVELGAPVIRVWAGNKASIDSDDNWYNKIIDESNAIGKMASDKGIKIAYEYHQNTLLDTLDSADKVMQAVNTNYVGSYWQPLNEHDMVNREQGLNDVLDYLTNVHMYYWPDCQRAPLEDGVDEWNKYFSIINNLDRDVFALIEFVKDDSTEQFLDDAKALRQLANRYNNII